MQVAREEGIPPEPQEETQSPTMDSASVNQLRLALDERDARLAKITEEVECLRREAQAQQHAHDALRAEAGLALERYRVSLLERHPELPPEMVAGDSVAEVEEAVRRAHQLVERVQRQVEARLAQERVPAGAPPRRQGGLSSLSPREKIVAGLQQLTRQG
ncbi:MAG: hypothetical protein HY683_04270 [Chloroflexi bacterium]|nr:hypothetical protein [Chloroflexota bacterium]